MATYKELLELLGSLYGADADALEGKMRGRLQNLAKLGVPIGGGIGKGKRFDYGRSEVYQIVFCLELAEIGLMPAQASEIVKRLWASDLGMDFSTAGAFGPLGNDRLVVIFSNAMSSAWRESSIDVEFVDVSEFADRFAKTKPGARHFSVVNITALAAEVESRMAGRLPHPLETPP